MSPNYLQKLTTSGIWKGVDLSKITPEMVNTNQHINGASNLIELAILSNTFSRFPKQLINSHGLITLNSKKETPLHLAAERKQLKYIPRHLFSKENLTKANGAGTNPMHYAAQKGCLSQIPKEFLTDKLLKIENIIGLSCIHFAVSGLEYCEIYRKSTLAPKQLLSEIKLIIKNLCDESLKYYISNKNHSGEIKIIIRDKLPYSLIIKELHKRKVLEHFSKKQQSIEI